jgi:hypothetical protein
MLTLVSQKSSQILQDPKILNHSNQKLGNLKLERLSTWHQSSSMIAECIVSTQTFGL